MRCVRAAKIRPEAKVDLLRALEDGSFGDGFPYGDLGTVICTGRVDKSGLIRWVEVCYCRDYFGVAMHEELPFLKAYLADIEVADARSPRYCKGYPECNSCKSTRKVRLEGEPLLDHLRRVVKTPCESPSGEGKPTRWLGWRGQVEPDEAARNQMGEMNSAAR
jgi:hypothetical protein